MSSEVIRTINPTTGEMLMAYESQCWQDLETVLDRATLGQGQWSHTTIEERSSVLMAVSKLLLSRRQELAQLVTQEMGKSIAESRAEKEKCALTCEYYAENAVVPLT